MMRLCTWSTALLISWVMVCVARAQPVCDNWSVSFEPDQSTFRPSDVITGRIHIQCPRDETGLPGSAYCRQVAFVVVAPDGLATEMSERGLYGDEAKLRIFLGRGEEVLRPVCLAKWGGQFVFGSAGEYKITAELRFEDFIGGDEVVLTAPPVVVKVVGAQLPPPEYLAEFDRYQDICGYFRYGMSHHGVHDLATVTFGAYDESICAFMNYQLWHGGVNIQLHPDSDRKLPTLTEIGMSNCRARLNCDDCRGSWVIDRLGVMMREGHALGRPGSREFVFVAGDIVY